MFRALTVVDEFTRECLAIEVDTSLPAVRVASALDRIAITRRLPATISVDNGPEFAGRTLDEWAHTRGVVLDFIRPGKPVDNAYIESFNGRFRDECLNAHWFLSVADARRQIGIWRGVLRRRTAACRPGRSHASRVRAAARPTDRHSFNARPTHSLIGPQPGGTSAAPAQDTAPPCQQSRDSGSAQHSVMALRTAS